MELFGRQFLNGCLDLLDPAHACSLAPAQASRYVSRPICSMRRSGITPVDVCEADQSISPTDLLTRGLFHDRIIPPLNSRGLEVACEAALEVVGEVRTAEKNRWRLPQRSRCSEHSVPKRKHLRRRLSIPNPRHQAILCLEVSANWADLRKICGESPISLTAPRISGSRAIEGSQGRQGIASERALRSVGEGICFKRTLPDSTHPFTHMVSRGRSTARAKRALTRNSSSTAIAWTSGGARLKISKLVGYQSAQTRHFSWRK